MNQLTLENRMWWKANEPHWWWINLLPEDERKIFDAGQLRNKTSDGLGWTPKGTDKSGIHHVHGFAGEWAVELIYNQPIRVPITRDYNDLRGGSDNGEMLQSKICKTKWANSWALNCNVGDVKPQHFYSLTLTCLWPKWLVNIGWAKGEDILELGVIKKHPVDQHPYHSLDLRFLSPPKTLFDEIR